MAHFELPPGETSSALRRRTLEEIWFFLSGRGEMWRKNAQQEEIVAVDSGVCLTIPLGTEFQFRSFGYEALSGIGITMPPWPGEDEAVSVKGKWNATTQGTLRRIDRHRPGGYVCLLHTIDRAMYQRSLALQGPPDRWC